MSIIGQALIAVAPETRGFAGAVNREVTGAMKGLSGTLSSVGKTLTTAVTAPLVGFAAVGVKAAADVDKGLREVNTLFGLTGKAAQTSFAELQKGVAGLSKEVGIAQSTITQGLYQAISAGVPRENVFDFMQVASKAAVAGVSDVETAVDGITSIVNAFGLSAKDAQSVADSMFTSVKQGKLTFDQLSSSIFQVAPAAAAAGVGMKETLAAIATLTGTGTPAAVATTQIRAALVGLQRPSEDMTKIFQKLGFENAQTAIKAKGLQFALDAVADAAGGDAGKLQTLLGSVEAVAAANVLAGTGAGKFKENLDGQAQAAGATQKAFEEMEQSTSRKLERMKVTVQNLSITLGNVLLPIVEKAAAFVAELAEKFQSLSPGMQKVVGIAVAAAAALGPLLLVTAKLVEAGKTVAPAFGKMASGMGKAAGAAVKLTTTIVTTTAQIIAAAARQTAAFVATAARAVASFALTAASAIASAAAVVAAWLVAAAPFIALGVAVGAVVLLIVKNWDTLKAATVAVFNAIVDFVKQFWPILLAVVTGGLSLVIGLIVRNWDTIKERTSAAWRAVADAVSTGVSTVVRFVTELPGKIVSALSSLGTKMFNLGKEAFESLKRGIESIIPKLMSMAGNLVKNLASKLNPANWFSTPEEHYRMLWGAAFDSIAEEARSATPRIDRAISNVSAAGSPSVDAAGGSTAAAAGAIGGATAPIVVKLIVDGKEFTQVIASPMADALRRYEGART